MLKQNKTMAVAAILMLAMPLAATAKTESAQTPPQSHPQAKQGHAATAPKSAKAHGSTAAEISGTALLNKQQQEKSAQQNAAYQARVAAAEQSQASSQAEYQARTEAYEADKARVAEKAAEQRLQWEADVRACEAGQKQRCAQPDAGPDRSSLSPE
jgi:hypothetical protein